MERARPITRTPKSGGNQSLSMAMQIENITPEPFYNCMKLEGKPMGTIRSEKKLTNIETKLITRAVEVGELGNGDYTYGTYGMAQNENSLTRWETTWNPSEDVAIGFENNSNKVFMRIVRGAWIYFRIAQIQNTDNISILEEYVHHKDTYDFNLI